MAAIAQAVIRTGSRVLIFNAGRNIEYGLRRDLFGHLCRMDPGFFRRHATGDVMSRLTNDLSAVRMLFGPGILNLLNTVMVYATGIWLLLRLSPRLTLIALVPYPALIFAARLWSRVIYGASRALQEQLGALSTTLQEDLAGIAVVKNYALEDRRHAGFAKQSEIYLQRALSLARTRGSLTPLFAVMGAMGTLIVLWAGGREVIAGRMTFGALIAFNAYLMYLSFPTIALGWILAVWQRGSRPGCASAICCRRSRRYPIARISRPRRREMFRRRRSPFAIFRSSAMIDAFWTGSRWMSPRAERWPSWDPPAREKPRWSTRYRACWRWRRARFSWVAATSTTCRSSRCGR